MTKLFAGNSNLPLSQKIAEHLKIPISKSFVGQFSDGEIRVEIQENVYDCEVFILQSTSKPTNHHLMELLLMADALHRAGAKKITAVIPYYGYGRQDQRKNEIQSPISAKCVADLLTTVGIANIITLDIHSGQAEGFFSIPILNIPGATIFLDDLQKNNYDNLVFVSPDIGGVKRARSFIEHIPHAELAIIDKRRQKTNEVKVMNIIGEVNNRHCVIIDDMIDTGKTLCSAAKALKEKGTNRVSAYVTHPVLSNHANSIAAIESSGLDELWVTDTIVLSKEASACSIIKQKSVAKILAEAIKGNTK